MALLIGCLALFLAAGYWLMGRVDAFLARSVVCEAGTKPRNDGIMARRPTRRGASVSICLLVTRPARAKPAPC